MKDRKTGVLARRAAALLALASLAACADLEAGTDPLSPEVGGPSLATSPGSPSYTTSTVGAVSRPGTGYLANAGTTCTRYVSTSGSDGNAGTSSSAPWATVAKALATVDNGAVVCVAPGTYSARKGETAFNGTETQPIVLRKTPGATGDVVLSAIADDPPIVISKDYWIVQDIEIDMNDRPDNGLRVDSAANYVTIRRVEVHSSAAGAAVSVRGNDVLIDDVEIHDNFRADGQDDHGIVIREAAARVTVRNSRLWDNGGDGVQCEDYSGGAYEPYDIWLEDNRIWTSSAAQGQTENAVDIKNCRRVSIRGTVSPAANASDRAGNKFYGFRARSNGTSEGAAIVIHYSANSVLVENTRIWDSCTGIAVGRGEDTSPIVQDLSIRRNVIFRLVSNSATGCKGDGIRISRADRVDIFHNTLDSIPRSAFRIGGDNTVSDPMDDVDVWNNIVRKATVWMDVNLPKVNDFASNNNLFWNSSTDLSNFRLNGTDMSRSTWNANTGADGSSIVADPLFVADPLNNDYYTQSTSPARDVARDNTSSPYGGSGPDIGFLETY
ncbi:MAG TPA: right-handed parallel beta-helix repeat-containing protein [Longimicrobium sp.]|nr:right-handed parallel beta-helix repeat-containing protein [Longimicrobium sp.]